MSESTALTIPQRAMVAFKSAEREKQLVALAAESVTITVITNAAGRDQCHAAMMRLKTARIEVEKEGKEIRDDAVKFGKGVIAEEKRLIEITSAEESRLQKLRDEWDNRIAAEKQAKIDKELARVAGIRGRIDSFAPLLIDCAGKHSSFIEGEIRGLVALDISLATFDEFVAQANEARASVLERLREMLSERQSFEAAQEKLRLDAIAAAELKAKQEAEAAAAAKIEAEKVAAERAELAKLRAENERLAKIEQERQAEAARREREQLDRERAQQEAANKAEQDRIAAERAAMQKAAQEELDRIEAEDAKRKAEAARAEYAANVVREAEEARIAAERKALEDEKAASLAKMLRERTKQQNEDREIIVNFVADKWNLVPSAALARIQELFS